MQDYTNDRESTLIRRPRELVVTVQLPGVESAGVVELDIFERKMTLQCGTPVYKLDVSPHNIVYRGVGGDQGGLEETKE